MAQQFGPVAFAAIVWEEAKIDDLKLAPKRSQPLVKDNGDEANRRAVRQEIGVERRALRKTQVYALPHPLHMPRIVGSIGRDCERVSRC